MLYKLRFVCLFAVVGFIFNSCEKVASCPVPDGKDIINPAELHWTTASLKVSSPLNGDGWYVPKDFVGISFESDAIEPGHRGTDGYMFDATNVQVLQLFKNAGMHVLRIGGVTVDSEKNKAMNRSYIDRLFAFAQKAGVKVIWSLPFFASEDEVVNTARFVWDNYKDLLYCFAIGNEPESVLYDNAGFGEYSQFIPRWKQYAKAVLAVIPEAKFTGHEAGGWLNYGNYGFLEDTRDEPWNSAILEMAHHQYPNGNVFTDKTNTTKISKETAVAKMMSPSLLTGQYASCQRACGDAAWERRGFRCRETEANCFLTGVEGACDAFARAIWALDYMGWQATHGLIGINFHNNQWIPTCTFLMDKQTHEYYVSPNACATRAFDLVTGSHAQDVSISTLEANVTGYAFKNIDDGYLYIVLTNKEYGKDALSVKVSADVADLAEGKVEVMYMTAPDNDIFAQKGFTLGGDTFENDRDWNGKWSCIGDTEAGKCIVSLVKTSGAIVRIPLKK